MTKIDIKSMTMDEISDKLKEFGQPEFRAKQIFTWLHKGAASFEEMTNIPALFRKTLEEVFCITTPEAVKHQKSKADGTEKILWRLRDGNCVETVFMVYEHGNTVCLSTQAGCAMGCAFCASAVGGKVRNLTPSEMLDQVIYTRKAVGKKISNLVLMGIGEPLDNFDNVIRFLELVNSADGLNIGMRHVTLSTCGIIKRINQLADLKLQLTLSVSLHAPDDETRDRIMPINKKYGVDALIAACNTYYDRTGRRVSYEYAMIGGVNDAPRQARILADKLSSSGAHINLIPLNSVKESGLRPSDDAAVKAFKQELEKHGLNVTVRRKLGYDIDASCGQLRRSQMA